MMFMIFRRPLIVPFVLLTLFRVILSLRSNSIKDLVGPHKFWEPLIKNESDWQLAEWLVRGTIAKLKLKSPCLAHSLTMFRLSGDGARLRISARRESQLSAHASIIFCNHEYSMAKNWNSGEAFAEFEKGLQHGSL